MNWETLYKRSYTKYSGKADAAVVVDESDTMYPGVRIENIAFPDTISAEQAAIYSCLCNGAKPVRLYLKEDNRMTHPLLGYWVDIFQIEVVTSEELPDVTIYQPLLPDDVDVDKLLNEMLDEAIVPYSHFPVSALLHSDKGFVGGVNIECADWRLGLCAERIAIARALSAGITSFRALHVHTRYGEFSSPCGACRQVIIEHLPGVPVHLHHADGSRSVHQSQDLLPYSFRSSALSNRYNHDS